MKYQYRFATECVEVDIDEEWVCVLREFDRQERNGNIKAEKGSIHYDAFGFVPDFMGLLEKGYSPKDETLAQIFDGSPAFEYALEHLTPRHCDVILRRAVLEESFPSIANSYHTDTSVIHSYYYRTCDRIRKYYDDWHWLNSNENEMLPGSGKVSVLTHGLSRAEIIAIRKHRYNYKSIREIAQVVGVSRDHVVNCLRDNPILETKCPACGSAIEQGAFGAMKVFCSRKCYFHWFRRNSQDPNADLHTISGKVYLTEVDKIAIDFYRQLYIPVPQIASIIRVSRHHVSAHIYSNPLPYTICWHCSAPIPGRSGGKPRKFCSDECYWGYYNRDKLNRKQISYKSPGIIIPTAEQIKYAIALFISGFSLSNISGLSGLDNTDIERLFRFSYLIKRTCPFCGDLFINADVEARYCSEECQCRAQKSNDKYFKTSPNYEDIIMDRRFPTKVVTGIVSITNTHIWEPCSINGSTPIFTTTIMIPKEDTKTLDGINTAIEHAIKIGASLHRGKYAQAVKRHLPIHDGDDENSNLHYQGHMVVNASSTTPPIVFDTQIQPILDRTSIFPGCKVRVSLTFFPICKNGVSAIGCMLGNFQRVKTDERCTLLSDISFHQYSEEFLRILDKDIH